MSSPKSTTAGITISVTAETHAGCRKHMEDYLAVKLYPNEELRTLPHLKEQAYIGVFDGHGGKEAAKCARERLWDIIQNQPKYRLSDIESVKESLEEAFLALHKEMEPLRGNLTTNHYTVLDFSNRWGYTHNTFLCPATWKRNKTGDLSTAGTTASTVIFRQDHIFVANVGDSTAILAVANPDAGRPNQHPVKAVVLTKDHKPEDPDEIKNIENLGESCDGNILGGMWYVEALLHNKHCNACSSLHLNYCTLACAILIRYKDSTAFWFITVKE